MPKYEPPNTIHVQYGCGDSAPDGWLNFDASPTLQIQNIPVLGRVLVRQGRGRFPANVRYGDIVRGLPLAAGSVAGLYASHVLEHLCLNDFRKAIKNSYRLLLPAGIFRLVVPDLRPRAERYVASNSPSASIAFLEMTGLGEIQRPRGTIAKLISTFGNSSHRWMWDEHSMTEELQRAGFRSIRRCKLGDSADPMFAFVEDQDRFIDGDIVELAMECRRPRQDGVFSGEIITANESAISRIADPCSPL